MYQLISLERCSRLATVASEENEGSPMIGRFRRPHMRTIGRDRRRITSGAEGGAFSAQNKQKRLTEFRDYAEAAEVSIEDPSFSLAEPSLESHLCNRTQSS